MSHPHLRIAAVLVTLWAVMVPAAWGEEPLRLQIKPVAQRLRSHAPLAIEIGLDWQRSGLLEGTLELDFIGDEELLIRYRCDDLVLTGDSQRFRAMLPATSIRRGGSDLVIRPRFVGTDATYEPEELNLSLPTKWQRRFVIGMSRPIDIPAAVASIEFVQTLQLEHYLPRSDWRADLTSSVMSMPTGDLPTQALGYFSYDMLFLEAEGFTLLSSRQLAAIADWVEAGGSVCVFVNRTIENRHVEFLNRIAGADTAQAEYLSDDSGRLVSTRGDPPQQFRHFRTGLGRAVISRQTPRTSQELQSMPWRRAVAFLWRVKAGKTPSMLRDGVMQFRRGTSEFGYPVGHPFQPQPMLEADALANLLIPEKVSGLPLSVVASILILFLIVIGPVDYYLLGYFNARKYTWVLFPLVSLGFALYTVQLSKQYLGDVDYRIALVFNDLGEQNRVARSSRFETVFAATGRTMDSELRNVLFTPLDPKQPFERLTDSGYSAALTDGSFAQMSQNAKSNLPIFMGRMPTLFTVRQQMRQWSPRMSRQTTLLLDAPRFSFDWESIDPLQFGSPEGRSALYEQILAADSSADAFLFNGTDVYRLHVGENSTAATETHAFRKNRLLSLIRKVCVRPSVGLFELISQIAPTGGAHLEDLTLLDSSDPNQWLLAVITTEGDDTVVYRKLFTTPR